ncbi:MAG: class F sortase [Chloroflexia bacterium]|nr:class F sortase [Chloroflexia bacterium]
MRIETSPAQPRQATWRNGALALMLVALLLAPMATRAQDNAEETPTANPIVSTRTGEVPSFGGRRPGPVGDAQPEVVHPAGIQPISIAIARAAVNAEIEPLKVVDGKMPDPSGPWVVAWYENLAGLGEGSNVVMAGHIDYWNIGPAVFYTISQLAEGDEIAITGADGEVYQYGVEWVRQYEAADAPIEEIVGRAAGDVLTLITCGGTFDYATGEYLQRTVVRANLIEA